MDLKEHASSLASSGLKKDSRLKTLEIALEQKKEECLKMESQLKKVEELPFSLCLHKNTVDSSESFLLPSPPSSAEAHGDSTDCTVIFIFLSGFVMGLVS